MPEMGGVEATRRIREQERETGRHIPIVAMTAHAMAGDRERFLAAGMDEYISKPISQERLREVVRSLGAPALPSPRQQEPTVTATSAPSQPDLPQPRTAGAAAARSEAVPSGPEEEMPFDRKQLMERVESDLSAPWSGSSRPTGPT
jgi:CheY-like chemotaxis protein